MTTIFGNSFFGGESVLGSTQVPFSELFSSSVRVLNHSLSRFFSRFFRIQTRSLPLNRNLFKPVLCREIDSKMVHFCAELSLLIRAFVSSSACIPKSFRDWDIPRITAKEGSF
ncbi:hypothetical protein, partial [Leptospira alexanderi]|uniref:hypothetical protein n=1 Tax=Leptospira alexanderi TaxID=100053 RepID=UPI001C37BD05